MQLVQIIRFNNRTYSSKKFTSEYQNHHIIDSILSFTGWRCFGAGMGLHLLFTVTRHTCHAHFAAEASTSGFCGQLWMRLVRTLYTYAFSLACNCHWRGIWILLDDWFGKQAGYGSSLFSFVLYGEACWSNNDYIFDCKSGIDSSYAHEYWYNL